MDRLYPRRWTDGRRQGHPRGTGVRRARRQRPADGGAPRCARRLQSFGAGVRSLGTRIAAIGTAGLAPLAASVRSFASAGDVLDKMSRRTGISVEALSELGFAAEQSGADLATLEKGVRTMQRAINDLGRGLSTQTDAFGDLDLTMADLEGRSPEEQFKLVAERLSRVEDASKRAAIAQMIFGRAGTQLLPLMQNGARGIEELQEQARSLGLTISTQTAKDAALLTDTLNIMWRVVKQGVFVVGSALAPTVIDLTNAVVRAVVTATQWVRENKALVVTVAKVAAGVAAAGIAIIGLGLLIAGVGAVFGLLAGAVGAVGTAIGFIGTALGALLSPIGLVVAAVVGLGTGAAGLVGRLEARRLAWLRDQFGRLREFVGKVIGGIADALAAGDITLAAEILWLSLKLVWQRGVAELNKVWLRARAFFVGTAQKMWFGALAAAQQVLHALEVAWIETTAFLSKTWTRFTSGFTKIWEQASAFVAKRMLEIQGLFDAGLDVDAAKEAVDEQLKSRLAEIDQGAQRDLSRREQRRQTQRDGSRELNEGTLAEIGRQFEEDQQALQQGTDARLAETQQQLEEARRRLDEAIAEARRKREEADTDGTPRRGPGDLLADLEDRLAGIGDAIAARISVRGTFNAARGARPRRQRRRRRAAPPALPSRLPRTPSVSPMPRAPAG
ncbi:MAG: phage tail tape measure protein [Planctomycetota bacterium]|nr:MAG: phage tail tape measure protein [Planctomycetota bacterium]